MLSRSFGCAAGILLCGGLDCVGMSYHVVDSAGSFRLVGILRSAVLPNGRSGLLIFCAIPFSTISEISLYVFFVQLEEKFNTRTAIAALGPRMVHLARCFNMRDLGTLKTADKRHYIRPNVLFRSDRLSRLYQADVDAIDERTGGVGLVLDFRTEYERSVAPDQLSKVKPPRYVALPVGEGPLLLSTFSKFFLDCS
jgi:hypothetical protein